FVVRGAGASRGVSPVRGRVGPRLLEHDDDGGLGVDPSVEHLVHHAVPELVELGGVRRHGRVEATLANGLPQLLPGLEARLAASLRGARLIRAREVTEVALASLMHGAEHVLGPAAAVALLLDLPVVGEPADRSATVDRLALEDVGERLRGALELLG